MVTRRCDCKCPSIVRKSLDILSRLFLDKRDYIEYDLNSLYTMLRAKINIIRDSPLSKAFCIFKLLKNLFSPKEKNT